MRKKTPNIAAKASNIPDFPKEEVSGFAQKGRSEIEAISGRLRELINGTKSVDFLLAPPEAQREYMKKVDAAIRGISEFVTEGVKGLTLNNHVNNEKQREPEAIPLAKLIRTVEDLKFPPVESSRSKGSNQEPPTQNAPVSYSRNRFYNLRISGLLAQNPKVKTLFLGDIIQLQPKDFPELGKKWLIHLIDALANEGLQLGTVLAPESLEKFEQFKQEGYQKENAKKLEKIDVDIDILMIPISFLELTTRAEKALQSKDIQFLGDLIQQSFRNLLRIKNCGVNTALEIKEAVENVGLELDTPIDPKLKEEFQVAKTQE